MQSAQPFLSLADNESLFGRDNFGFMGKISRLNRNYLLLLRSKGDPKQGYS